MSQTLELIIKARDEATAKLKGLSGGLDGLKAAMSAVTVGVIAARLAWKEIFQPVIDYNKAILDTSRAIGMNVEDFARLVQVGDDVEVSMASIETSFKMATKNGFAPSIDSIADLIDRTEAMESPTERAAELAKIFGRNWAAIDPILQMGSQRFREMAGAVEGGLAPTEAMIRDTERLRINLDALNDKALSIRNTFVQGLAESFYEVDEAAKRGMSPALFHLQEELNNLALAAADGVTEVGFLANGIAGLQDKTVTVTYQQIGTPGGGGDPHPSYVSGGFYWTWNEAQQTYVRGKKVDPEKPLGEGRALGGEVGGGGSYIVGEHGAERFTPGQSGTISPSNDQLTQEIRRMVRTLPTILRDAVQKS